MSTFLIIVAVFVFDFLLSLTLRYFKNRQDNRDDDLFCFKLEQIMSNPNKSTKDRIEEAKNLCRDTEGKLAAGAYLALDKLPIKIQLVGFKPLEKEE